MSKTPLEILERDSQLLADKALEEFIAAGKTQEEIDRALYEVTPLICDQIRARLLPPTLAPTEFCGEAAVQFLKVGVESLSEALPVAEKLRGLKCAIMYRDSEGIYREWNPEAK